MASERVASSHQRPTRPKAWRGFLRSESKSYDRTIVGRRIRVCWESDRVWYQGVRPVDVSIMPIETFLQPRELRSVHPLKFSPLQDDGCAFS